MFIVCNLPRIVLNFEEFYFMIISYWDSYNFFDIHKAVNSNDDLPKVCYSPPYWSYIVKHVSDLLLTLNASVCSIVYCVICKTFRAELSKRFKKVQDMMATFSSPSSVDNLRTVEENV